MAEIVDISGRADRHPVDPDAVLDRAREARLPVVCVVGLDPDGYLYLATSSGDPHLDFWLLHRGAAKLLHFFEPTGD